MPTDTFDGFQFVQGLLQPLSATNVSDPNKATVTANLITFLMGQYTKSGQFLWQPQRLPVPPQARTPHPFRVACRLLPT